MDIVSENAKKNKDARIEATRNWAQNADEQLQIARQKGGLSLWDKAKNIPNNLWHWANVEIMENKDTNHQEPDSYRDNLYSEMLKSAESGAPAPREVRDQWRMLKKRGFIK